MAEVSSRSVSWRGQQGTAEASSLGWRAGDWPLAFDMRSSVTGIVQRFRRSHRKFFNGELVGFYYHNGKGVVIDVLND